MLTARSYMYGTNMSVVLMVEASGSVGPPSTLVREAPLVGQG